MQPQKNLFFHYRGSQRDTDSSDLVHDRQLEDNATKALIYVLENTDRTKVLSPFLQKVAQIRTRMHLERVQFALQRSDIARPKIQRRIALSIAPATVLDERNQDSHELGRPDAWVWQEGEFAIFIETKVRGQTTLAQLQRHIATADGWDTDSTEIRTTSWSEIYTLFQRVRQSSQLDPVTQLLLREMVRYIRMIGLSGTTTFDLEDFGYFMIPPKDRDDTQRSILQEKLSRFAQDLSHSPAMRSVIKRYAGKESSLNHFVHPGIFRKDARTHWITLGSKERRDRCHFTVRVSEQGITLEAFSPHKSYTRKLIRKIRKKPGEFVASLKMMMSKEPYFLRLREAYYHDKDSAYRGQRIDEYVDFLVIHPSAISDVNLESLILSPIEERLERSDLRPEVFVIREFPLSTLIGKTGLVDLMAATAESMFPFFQFALDL